MESIFKMIADGLQTQKRMSELERYARAEYKKDWQHAYAMLRQGKKPDFTGVMK
jgi:hypothetical protein